MKVRSHAAQAQILAGLARIRAILDEVSVKTRAPPPTMSG
jgi:hypothetical protein